MTCCCQSIHQRRPCESTAGGIQMRLLCGLPGGSWKIERGCSHGSVENALQMKGVTTVKRKPIFHWTMSMWGRVFSLDMSYFLFMSSSIGSWKFWWNPILSSKISVGSGRDCGSKMCLSLKKWPVKKRNKSRPVQKCDEIHGKRWLISWYYFNNIYRYGDLRFAKHVGWGNVDFSVIGDHESHQSWLRSQWKRVKMWEYCHAGMSAPAFFVSGDARGSVGTSIVCKVKHRCFGILKHCGLFCCFPRTLKQPEKRHTHGSINLSRQLEKWDPPLMTYPRRSCINMLLRICPKEEDMPTDKYSKRWFSS